MIHELCDPFLKGTKVNRSPSKTDRVEAVVDEVLEVLAHADLLHQFVLVAVHASQLSNVREDILHAVRQLQNAFVRNCFAHRITQNTHLKGVDIVQSVLHMRIDD